MQYALKGSKDLTSLVEDVSKVIELRGQDDTRELQNLDEILESTLFNLKNEISQYNGLVNHQTLGDFKCKATDMTLLFQNIILNGLKYNKSFQPTVKIKSELKNDKRLISFSDNGIGIEREYQEKIFDFFQRLHVKSDYEGTGIGLGICNYIVGKYNGQIHVESTIGKGSTFIVELPC